jgi:hypothetical protein
MSATEGAVTNYKLTGNSLTKVATISKQADMLTCASYGGTSGHTSLYEPQAVRLTTVPISESAAALSRIHTPMYSGQWGGTRG